MASAVETQSREVLLRSLRQLQTSGDYSDLKIFCGNEVFPVHRAIVCPRSKFFEGASRWKQDGSLKHKIELEEDDPKLIRLMIDYLYRLDYDDLITRTAPDQARVDSTGEALQAPNSRVTKAIGSYDDLGKADNSDTMENAAFVADLDASEHQARGIADDTWGTWGFESKKEKKKRKALANKDPPADAQLYQHSSHDVQNERLTINAHMYALADKYAIDDLKELARVKFEEAIEVDWNTRSFAYAAESVFATTPESDLGLRNIVVATIEKHRELIDYEEFQKLLKEGNGIAWALVQFVFKKDRDFFR